MGSKEENGVGCGLYLSLLFALRSPRLASLVPMRCHAFNTYTPPDDDLVIGNKGRLRFFRRSGAAGAAVYTEVTGAENPFASVQVGGSAAPAFGDDWNGDGVPDLLVGSMPGANKFKFFLSNFCRQSCNNEGICRPSANVAVRQTCQCLTGEVRPRSHCDCMYVLC